MPVHQRAALHLVYYGVASDELVPERRAGLEADLVEVPLVLLLVHHDVKNGVFELGGIPLPVVAVGGVLVVRPAYHGSVELHGVVELPRGGGSQRDLHLLAALHGEVASNGVQACLVVGNAQIQAEESVVETDDVGDVGEQLRSVVAIILHEVSIGDEGCPVIPLLLSLRGAVVVRGTLLNCRMGVNVVQQVLAAVS